MRGLTSSSSMTVLGLSTTDDLVEFGTVGNLGFVDCLGSLFTYFERLEGAGRSVDSACRYICLHSERTNFLGKVSA